MSDDCNEETSNNTPRRPGRPPGRKERSSAARARRKRKALSLLVRQCDLPTVHAATGISTSQLKSYRRELEVVFPELANIEHFRVNKVDIMDAAMAGILKTMASEEKLQKASINNAAYAAKQLHEMGRLERGLSTSNVATFIKLDLPK